jgi:hypothetical protein
LALCEKFGFGERALPVLFSQFSYRMAAANMASGLEVASRIVRLGNESRDDAVCLVGQRAVGFCNLCMGNLTVAEQALEAALRFGEQVDHRSLAFQLGHDPVITAQAFYGMLKLKRGYPEHGQELLARAVDRAWQDGHGPTIAYTLLQRARFDALLQDYVELKQTSTALLELCDRQGILSWRTEAALFREVALFHLGEQIDLSATEGILRDPRRATARQGSPQLMLMLADAYAHNREPAVADNWLDEALSMMERTAERLHLPEACLLKARLAAAEQHNEPALERWLERSLEAASEQQARFSELRAATELGRHRLAQRRRAEAREALEPVYSWFTEGHTTRALQEAADLWRSCAEGSARVPHSLTGDRQK